MGSDNENSLEKIANVLTLQKNKTHPMTPQITNKIITQINFINNLQNLIL